MDSQNNKDLVLIMLAEGLCFIMLQFLKMLFPVSSRSFHGRMERIENNQSELQRLTNNLSIQVNDAILMMSKTIQAPDISCLGVSLLYECNLDCKYCFACAPLAENGRGRYDIDQFRADMVRLNELFAGNIPRINLSGGEPLLHPNLIEFIEVSRGYFPKARITILTNAILLPTMPDTFWEVCCKTKTEIVYSKYPLKIDYEAISQKAYHWNVGFSSTGDNREKGMTRWVMDPKGEQDPRLMFLNCYMATNCVGMKNGKISTCGAWRTAELLNRAFHTEFEVTGNDYIDIYKAQSKDEIMKYLCKPAPFCRYCRVHDAEYGLPWALSERSKSEWIYSDKNVEG